MNRTTTSPWLHRIALLTAGLTLLLTVGSGAVVTTLKAGMIFADWPTSDGHNMFLYPWMSSNRDQFVEHGHRLAGALVGLLSTLIFFLSRRSEPGSLVRWLGGAVLLGVIGQGLLGGLRVRMDRDVMALIHGDFGALVFSVMLLLVVVTSSSWKSRLSEESDSRGRWVRNLSAAVVASIAVQYVIGGMLRHLGTGWAWLIHPWFAIVPSVAVLVLFAVSRKSMSVIVRRAAVVLVCVVFSQVMLGLATWFVRYGVAAWGVVAQRESAAQVVICSLHKVLGVVTFATSVVTLVSAQAALPIQIGSRLQEHDVDNRVTSVESGLMGATT